MLDTLTSPKGIGIYFMIYKDVQIYIQGKEIIQINKRKARKLYDAGYEVFLHPCKMAFDSLWKEPCEISKEILTDMEAVFHEVCKDFGAELKAFNGEADHVHLLVNYPPKIAVSRLVNSLKGVSSRMLRKKRYPRIIKSLWGDALWSPSYFAGSCGGAPIALLKQYIEQQKTPH